MLKKDKIYEAYKSTILTARKFNLNEETELNEAYKVAQNPSDKKWYALGSVGKYWMPVSSGYKSKKEAEAFAKKQPLADKDAKKLMPEETELNEASEVRFEELNPENQDFVRILVGKANTNKQTYFDGIHGQIVNFHGLYGDRIRVQKKDLKKIMNDKNVRWIDIASIGF